MSEENKEETVDLQQATKTLVLNELEKNGVLSLMRAKIKKSVIDIIDKQKDTTKQKIDFDYITPLHRQNKTKEVVLLCHLIKEFLQFYEMEYTFPIFENESNIKETVKRETLLKEFSLKENKDEPKPVLLSLIEDIKAKNKQIEEVLKNNSRINSNAYGSGYGGMSNYEDTLKEKLAGDNYSNPIIPNKKQLNPINFTNKSIEMKDNNCSSSEESQKFNTLKMNSAYNQNPTKELTASDILNKNKPKAENPLSTSDDGATKKISLDNYETNNPNNNDDEFQEMILEELPPKKEEETEENKQSASNINSLGYDQSVSNYNLNEYDYVEPADKP